MGHLNVQLEADNGGKLTFRSDTYIKHECFIRFPYTEKRVENTTRSEIFLTKFEVWKSDETLSRVFDISAQSKPKLRSKRRNKIVKIYAD